jgi:integrase
LADDEPVCAAGRRKAKGYRTVLRAFAEAVTAAKIEVASDERLSPHSLRHTYTSHLIIGLELDAATASKLARHANPAGDNARLRRRLPQGHGAERGRSRPYGRTRLRDLT